MKLLTFLSILQKTEAPLTGSRAPHTEFLLKPATFPHQSASL
jgi:hypothetical protein